MTGALLSSWWYRVAERKPRLRSHARLHRHRYRGEVWYLLQDAASPRVHRFTPAARLVISLMDGTRSVAELWQIANRHLGDDAPSQDELIELLGQLHAADLLESDVSPDVAELFARGEREERARYLRSFGNPMAIRIPVWDPDAFLARFDGLVRLIWSRWGFVLWLAVVLPAAFLIAPHWPELSHNFSDRVLAVDNLLVLYLAFPVIKLLHELGHATATKAGGGEVHDLGVILLVLLPVPYVDASAATVFRSKYRRALVGAAGVAVELFIAALAFYLWLLIEAGLLRAILFNIMLIASVSSLLFNGNPLLRYDAYYVLADLIEIPNLAAQSARYWRRLLERYLLGVRDAEPVDASAGEKAWFVFYGAASTIYRILVTIVIALFIATRFFVIGVVLAIWAVVAMALVPLARAIMHLLNTPRLRKRRSTAMAGVVGVVGAALGFLLFVPVAYHSRAEGVLWLPEQAIVRAGANGFADEFLAEPGTAVGRGDVLIQSSDPGLEAQRQRSLAKVAELEAEYTANFPTDRAKAQISSEKLKSERANLSTIRSRLTELTVRAAQDGVFVVPQSADMPGHFYRKGEQMGYVVGNVQPIVRVVVPQDGVDPVRSSTEAVHIRLVDRPGVEYSASILREVPAGADLLPSAALAVDGGGEIATDPRETKGPKALDRMFQFDLEFLDAPRFAYFGQRVFVRFEHRREPLAVQWYRSVRLLFMSSFNV
jgi:putative peptide zinc metalloprotease protein